MKLFMDPAEILRSYRNAENRFRQVKILAEQNLCTVKEMAQWLKEQGMEVDKRYLQERVKLKTKTEPPRAEEPEPEPKQEPVPEQKPQKLAQTGKDDAGKPRLSLVPMQIMFDIAAVREYGCKKYSDPDNWKRVDPALFRDAMLRHMLKYIDDPDGVDEESGLPHRWHIECNLAFLAEMEKRA